MTKGWMCPQCGKAHGPHVDTCPGGVSFTQPVVIPTYRPWPEPSPTIAPWRPPFETTCGGVTAKSDPSIMVRN